MHRNKTFISQAQFFFQEKNFSMSFQYIVYFYESVFKYGILSYFRNTFLITFAVLYIGLPGTSMKTLHEAPHSDALNRALEAFSQSELEHLVSPQSLWHIACSQSTGKIPSGLEFPLVFFKSVSPGCTNAYHLQ